MPRGKKYRAEEIIPKLREAEILISQGSTQELAAKNIGLNNRVTPSKLLSSRAYSRQSDCLRRPMTSTTRDC